MVTTTTDENGIYEFVSPVLAAILMVSGGKNTLTGESFDDEFEVKTSVSYNVNPASEMASDLVEEGMSVEEAKDHIVTFVNSDFNNVDGITKEDLFDRPMSEDMKNSDTKASKKAVIFNTLNNIKEMLVEAIETDKPTVENIRRVVRKSIAKGLSEIRHNEGDNVDFSKLVETTIERIDEEVGLVELKDSSKKSVLGSEIQQQTMAFMSIDTEDADIFEVISDVEVQRIRIKEHTDIVKSIVELDISNVEDEVSKLNEIKAEREKATQEANEKNAAKVLDFKTEAGLLRNRLEYKDELKSIDASITKLSKEIQANKNEFSLQTTFDIDMEIKSIYSQYFELKAEVEDGNENSKLEFDMTPFEAVNSKIEETINDVDKIRNQLGEVELPIREPGDGLAFGGLLGNVIGLHGGGGNGTDFGNRVIKTIGQNYLMNLVTPDGAYGEGGSYTWLPVVDKEAGVTTSNADVADKSVDVIMDAINSIPNRELAAPALESDDALDRVDLLAPDNSITLLGYSDGAAMIIAFLGRAIQRGLDISRIKRVVFIKGYAEGERHQGLDFSEAEFVPFEGIDSYFVAGQQDVAFYQSTLDAMSYFNEPGLVVNKDGGHEFELADAQMWLSERVTQPALPEIKEPIVGGGEIGGEPIDGPILVAIPAELIGLGPTDRWAKPGAIAKEGYYPLFKAAAGALQHAPEYHEHSFGSGKDQVTYYMPEGLNMEPGPTKNGWHGDFPMEDWVGIPLVFLPEPEFPGEPEGELPGVKEPIIEEPVVVTYKTGEGMVKFKKWMDYLLGKYALPQSFSLPTNESEFDSRYSEMKSAAEQLFEEAKLVDAEKWEMRVAQNYVYSWVKTNRFGGQHPNSSSEYRLFDLQNQIFTRAFESIDMFKPSGNVETLPNLQLKLL